MNKKLYFNLVFLIAGTFVFLTMSIIVGMNFFKDARIFQESVATAVQDPVAKSPVQNPSNVKEPEKEDYDTFKYKRAPGVIVVNKDPGEEGPLPKVENTKEKKEKYKVEVINYSGIKNLAEEIKSTLEASGYEVSAGNGRSNQPVKTIIIDRNDKKAGAEIQKILKAGTVTKWPDPRSRYDVTVKIGDDYRP